MATKKLVEPGLYAGRAKSTYKTKDEHENQGPADDQHAPGYCPDVPMSRRSADSHGLNPCFDVSSARKGNDKPNSAGGSNASKSPFSAAGRNISKD
jgi:hypothetical protein